MSSSTVDLMLVQVTGFMVAAVVLVLWLWIAYVRRWWPFDSGVRIQELFEHDVGFEAARMLTATALERESVSVPTITSAAGRVPSDALRCRARGPSRTLAMSARAESCDDVHTRACSRPDHASSGRSCGRGATRLRHATAEPRHRPLR